MNTKQNLHRSEAILVSLRRVIRAIDIHSRKLSQSHGLTGPQAVALKAVIEAGELSAGELAKMLSLSQATVTDIVKRLERRGLLQRNRDHADKRRVLISATLNGQQTQSMSPPLLQETFIERFQQLKEWEQHQLLASVQRIAELMDAETLDAAPLLTNDTTINLHKMN